jgi:hypothetical protein
MPPAKIITADPRRLVEVSKHVTKYPNAVVIKIEIMGAGESERDLVADGINRLIDTLNVDAEADELRGNASNSA